jgi:hypothetical protein
MPTLKNKSTAPFIQKIDPSIFLAWPAAKQQKYACLVQDFKTRTLQFLQDADDVTADHPPSQATTLFQEDPGDFGFGSNAL